jgi:hypothetical protein
MTSCNPLWQLWQGAISTSAPLDLASEQLLRLDPIALDARHFKRGAGVDYPAAGATAVVVLPVGVHFDHILTQGWVT